jgi:hypothetical protein
LEALIGSSGYHGSIATESLYGLDLNQEASDHLKLTPFALFILEKATQNGVIIFIGKSFVNCFLGHLFLLRAQAADPLFGHP